VTDLAKASLDVLAERLNVDCTSCEANHRFAGWSREATRHWAQEETPGYRPCRHSFGKVAGVASWVSAAPAGKMRSHDLFSRLPSNLQQTRNDYPAWKPVLLFSKVHRSIRRFWQGRRVSLVLKKPRRVLLSDATKDVAHHRLFEA
jgi:hypothetical protein